MASHTDNELRFSFRREVRQFQERDYVVQPVGYGQGYMDGTKTAKDHPEWPLSDLQDAVTQIDNILIADLVTGLDSLYADPKNAPICIGRAIGLMQVAKLFGLKSDVVENARTNNQDCQPKREQPTIDKETGAKIAARPDPFAQFGGISNDNAICKEAYPDLYQPHR
jgi:hypothetical protein